jgi:DDE_Tnp_1-associated
MLPTETLLEALARVPDPRARNRSHPLQAALALCVCAMLCGCRSLLAIHEWGRSHGPVLAKMLGFRRPLVPCVATLSEILRTIDMKIFEEVLGAWFGSFAVPTGGLVPGRRILALDGKTLRGTLGHQGVPGVALVAAFAVEQGVVVDQDKVIDSDELGAVRRLLQRLPLHDTIVTGDALQTQRDVCKTIVEKGGPTFSPPRTTKPPSSMRSTPRLRPTPRLASPAKQAATATASKNARSRSPTPKA